VRVTATPDRVAGSLPIETPNTKKPGFASKVAK
jgi:hypothetical protein